MSTILYSCSFESSSIAVIISIMYVCTYVFSQLAKVNKTFLNILNNNLYFGLILPMRAVGNSV